MTDSGDVVITGLGVVSPIGIGKDAYWKSMLEGRSGVGPLTVAVGSDLPVKIGGEIKGFDAKQFVKPRKSLKVMCREIQTGYAAAMLALQDAGVSAGKVDPDRFGVVLGSEMFYCDLDELADAYRKCVVDGQLRPDLWGAGAMSDLYPLWMLKYLPNMVACHIAITEDARGPNNTITLDEVSSLLAVIESVCYIQRGAADVMIAGGQGSRVNLTRIMYRGDEYWSHRNDEPARACRPFDAQRDGTVIGEGAGAFILESRRHAAARGANILARVLGFGRSFDRVPGHHAVGTDGFRRAIEGALTSAGLGAADIGHVNAHGSGMIEGDRFEAQAIRSCLGDVPVTAPKSYFGCLGAGTGAVEMAASVLAIATGLLPATLNYEFPDPACPVNVVRGQPLPVGKRTAVVLNQSETGQTAAVVLGPPD
jgi:3-oxoacyl-[acyl-carrier-protein] synthase II